ncbi:hypothetical protein ACW9HQ_53350, partial [Nocardia gipuzkoensis]
MRAESPYPGLLSQEDRKTIAYRDNFRPVDPCGYVDEAAIRRNGAPAYFGADDEFVRCSVSFLSPGGGHAGVITATVRSGGGVQLDSAQIPIVAHPL